MEERVEISILLDFYSELLTDKQKNIMSMYYNEDLSLGEIAELNSTSRQAIFDTIKRCVKLLQNYEGKLELKKKSETMDLLKKTIVKNCNIIKEKILDNEVLTYINEIEKDITENL